MSLIQELLESGDLELWHDYRAGHSDDLSGNPNDGVIAGDPIFTGRDGLRFDGVGDWLNCGNDASLNVVDMTLSGWIKPVLGTDQSIAARYVAPTERIWWWRCEIGGTLKMTIGNATGTAAANQAQTAEILSEGVWSHVAVVWTDGVGVTAIYINGVAATFADAQTYTSLNQSDNSTILEVGSRNNGLSCFVGLQRDFMLCSVPLTQTEIVQLMAETEALKWPSRPVTKAHPVSLAVRSPVPVSSVSMVPQGGELPSTPIPGDAFPLPDNIISGRSLPGPSIRVGGDALTLAAASYETTGSLWWSVWFRTGTDITTAQFVFSRYLNVNDNWGLRIGGGNLTIWDDIDNAGTLRYSTPVQPNTVYHALMGMDGDDLNKLWLDTVAADNDESSADDLASFAGNTFLGGLTATVAPFLGEILSYDVMDSEPSAVEIAAMYAAGANAVQFNSDWGVPVTVPASVGVGAQLGPFTVDSGAWRISMDEIEGQPVKVLECVTAGVVYVDMLPFGGASEAAFGTWEIWVRKDDTSHDMDLVFVADTIGGLETGTQNGYGFRYMNTDDGIYLYESVAGGLTEKGHFIGLTPAEEWYLLHLDRQFTGMLNMWVINDGGIGSALDLTTVTGRYICFELDAGDKVALSDAHGNHGFFKKLGAVT